MKILHIIAPNLFPLWDTEIAKERGVSTQKRFNSYWKFMGAIKDELGKQNYKRTKNILKLIDEYFYVKAHNLEKRWERLFKIDYKKIDYKC